MSKLGLKGGVRNPGSIVNIEHDDASGSKKVVMGSSGAIEEVIATSTTAFPLKPEASIRVYNNTASVQYLWVGKEADVPLTVDATNGLPLAPNSAEVFFCGVSEDPKQALMAKTSSASVLIVKLL